MAAHVFETPNEKAISGAMALVMHALFFAMLVLSVDWRKHEPVAMVAELWSSLPSPKADVPPPPPPPAPPKVEPEPPRPQPKAQPKAEIDLREKKERERKAKEELAEKKKLQDKELAEKKKREEQARQAKEATDAKRLAQEQAEALKKLAAQQAAQQASNRAKELDKYRAAIAERIKRFIVEPPNIQGNPVAELDIIMLPSGEVLDVRTKKASGQTAWDNACERAIRRAQPLPLPSDPALMRELRELAHLCRYKD